MEKLTKNLDWHKLDHNANLFSAISGKNLSNVFRVSSTLKEEIKPEFLQQALEETLPHFRAFNVRSKKGLFWNYLELNDAIPKVEKENDFPCGYIDTFQNNLFLFRVSYFGKRINLETFHVLTDGTGAIRFLLAICYKYLKLVHHENFSEKEFLETHGLSYATDIEDSYIKNYVPIKKETYGSEKAFALKGERFPLDAVAIIHGNISVSEIKKLSKEMQCTITQYICACIGWGIFTEKSKKTAPKYPINIFVPVNLRGYFDSTTSLNFFSGITVTLPFKNLDCTFEDVLEEVKSEFEKKLTKKAMLSKISYTVGDGYSLPARIAPFPLKALILKIIYYLSKSSNTITVTNVGIVKILPEFETYFEKFIILLSTSKNANVKASIGSFKDNLCLSFSSTLVDQGIQKAVFRKMSDDGLNIVIESNGVYNETM